MSRAHLPDDRLIEICLGDAAAPLEEPHLRTCEECEERRVALACTLNEATSRIDDEVDAAFPPERLAKQHARILHQVDHLGRPARVITFPIGHPSEPVRPAARRSRRWIAAAGAVAASFLVGIFTEHLTHQLPLGRPETRILASRSVDPAIALAAVTSPSDDELLGQIELAVGSAGPAVLAPLDALTPRAWDVR
jgi:hypothetical protein